MTRNQVAYHDLLEKIRSNKEKEFENRRSNMAKEAIEGQNADTKERELAHRINTDVYNAGMRVVDTLKDLGTTGLKIAGGSL